MLRMTGVLALILESLLFLEAATARADVTPLVPPAFSIGANFAGTGAGGFTPPDVGGSVGTNLGAVQIAEITNNNFAVFNQSGAALVQESPTTFFTNAGLSLGGQSPVDPRVIFDPGSGHWFASAITLPTNNQPNQILLAVSQSSDASGTWKAVSITASPSNSHWADFPTIGFNTQGLFLAANMVIAGTTSIDAVNYYTISKADLITAAVNNTAFPSVQVIEHPNSPTNAFYSPQPIASYDTTPTSPLSHPVLSDSGVSISQLKLNHITGTIAAPTLSIGTTQNTTAQVGAPPPAPQPPNPNNSASSTLNANDQRYSASVVLQNGNVWAVQNVMNSGITALHWVRLDGAAGSILEQGTISDPSLYFWNGSIAVSKNNDIVIGFNGSSLTQNVGSYVVVGHFDGSTTTFSTPTLVFLSQAVFNNGSPARWGDYSSTGVDPLNPNSFWTLQEVIQPDGSYGTQVTQINILAPGTPEPSSLALAALGVAGLWMCRRRLGIG